MAHRFVVVPYRIPRRCAATYYPETNVLVPIESVAERSNTPTSKGVIIRLVAEQEDKDASEGHGDAVGSDEGHKSDVEPHVMS